MVFRILVLFLGIFLTNSAALAFEVKGLKTPESFIADPSGAGFFISNINGQPAEKDNNGFITKLGTSGKIDSLRFIAGGQQEVTLHAPKGLDIIGQTLYAADIDTLRGFDKTTGDPVLNLDLSKWGASFLNDLTHDPQGNLYVTDLQNHMVLKIETRNDYHASVLIKDEALNGPNGIVYHPETGRLIVVTWNTGSILEIDPDGQLRTLLDSPGLKKLDGVGLDASGYLYTSSFTDGRIYKISPDFKKVRLFKEGLSTPADINLDLSRQLVLIPLFNKNQARTEKIR